MNEQNCLNCRYWHRFDDKEKSKGQCRRYAPGKNIDVVYTNIIPPTKYKVLTSWQTTEENDWCGEYSN